MKNAVANVARGGAAALVALILPSFLTRLMPPDEYGAWALVLAISAYVGYLDFGVQTAVGRFVAHANERGDPECRDSIVSTALAVLAVAAGIGICASLAIAALLPDLFRQMPKFLMGDARVALVIVASALAVGLPASIFNGIFVGLQRYEVPAVIVGVSKICAAVLLVLVVEHGGALTSMALAMAGINLASYVFQYVAYRKMAPPVRLSLKLVSRSAARELFDYCFSLSVWSLATLVITGLDLLLVGLFDFKSVAFYAVAATVITFILGTQNAIFSVLMPQAAVLEAQNKAGELGKMLLTTTRLGLFLLLASGIPLLILTRPILTLWVGRLYAAKAATILKVLVGANILRLSAVPYAVLLIGTGQQRLVILSPVLEASSNLLLSILLGKWMGAVGVALGTLAGAVVGLACNFVYNIPRTTAIAVNLTQYVRDGFLRPLVCVLPFLLVPIMQWAGVSGNNGATNALVFALAALAALLMFWIVGITSGQRQWLLSRIGMENTLAAKRNA